MSHDRNPMEEYLRFVGAYVNAFANLEHTIVYLSQMHSGLSREKFRIFIANQNQLGQRIGLLKKLVRLIHLDKEARLALADAFNQLDHLATLRHRVVHHGGNPVDPDMILIRSRETDIS